MLLLNFSHPLPPDQLARITELTGQPIDEVRQLPAQFDQAQPLIPQTAPLMVILPALNYIAAVVLAELHGRMGYFPPVVRLQPVEGALPPRYAVAEIINLQGVRDSARKKRIG